MSKGVVMLSCGLEHGCLEPCVSEAISRPCQGSGFWRCSRLGFEDYPLIESHKVVIDHAWHDLHRRAGCKAIRPYSGVG
eukprot:2915365-Amphidinium_carterae.1